MSVTLGEDHIKASSKNWPAHLPPSSSKGITILDVAARAGVTPTTVSSALHGTGRISATLRERIRKLARDLGYQPKLGARLMRAKQTGQVGLLLPDSDHTKSGDVSPILSHFVARCEERGLNYHIEFYSSSRDFRPPIQLTSGLIDGLLLGGYIDAALREWMTAQTRWPWVSIEEPGEYSVISASDNGIYQAAQHLAALGHRQIGYVGGPLLYSTHRLAKKGLEQAVRDFSLDTGNEQWIQHFDDGRRPDMLRSTVAWVADLLRMKRGQRPTAFLCHGIALARGVTYEAMRQGLKIPQDLSLFAVGPSFDTERALPHLSIIDPDFKAMTEQALDLLENRIQGRRIEQPQRVVIPKLVMYDTVAVPSPWPQNGTAGPKKAR